MNKDTLYKTLAGELFGPDAFESTDLLLTPVQAFVTGLVQLRWEGQTKEWVRRRGRMDEDHAKLVRELDSMLSK